MGAGVFVSYRRDDDPGSAGRVRDALAQHFGDDAVFFDRDSIRGGDRWERALDEALEASSALVLVVGPRWVACLQERLARPEPDHHLREITTALDRGLVVYPVRVQGAPMPDLDALPDVLRDRLPALQWRQVHDDLFRASMGEVAADLERLAGVTSIAAAAAADPAGRDEVVVGPWDTDADVHEIADAVALVAPGGRIRVRAGRYLKPVVLDRPVSVTGPVEGEALLDVDRSPAVVCASSGVVLRHLAVRTTADAPVGIDVRSGDLTADGVRIRAHRATGARGILLSGRSVGLVLLDGDLAGVEVGVAATAEADARIERTAIAAGGPGVDATGGATVRLTGCSLAAGAVDAPVVRAAEGGGVVVDDAALTAAGGPHVLVDGGSATVRGSRSATAATTVGSAAGRVVRAVPGARPAADDRARGGWTVEVAGGAEGRIEDAELAVLRLRGGAVRFDRCAIGRVDAAGPALDEFDGCELGQITVGDGAAPTFRSCTVTPDRGTKVSVDVGRGGRVAFEGGEVTGRNVRDGSPDPAVRVVGGVAELRGTTVRNPGEGVVWAEGGGEVVLVDADVRSTLNGPAIVVLASSVTASGTEVEGGVRVEGGSLALTGGGLGADAVSGRLVIAREDAEVTLVEVDVRGPGLARTRRVGRWIEARSEKVGHAAARLIGTSPLVLEAGGHVRFERCVATGIDLDAIPAADGLRVIDCAVADVDER